MNQELQKDIVHLKKHNEPFLKNKKRYLEQFAYKVNQQNKILDSSLSASNTKFNYSLSLKFQDKVRKHREDKLIFEK